MNCLDKMYKEIEEIKRKEELESKLKVMPIKEIRQDISFDNLVDSVLEKYDYLSQISLDGLNYQVKRLTPERAKVFTEHVLKKYIIFNVAKIDKEDALNYVSKINEKFKDITDIVEFYKESVNGLINLVGETEETIKFFTNPYNALFSDNEGAYAVIINGKFTDIKKPIGYIENQLKKVLKEIFEEYGNDYKVKFNSEKEYNQFMNSLKAYVNKQDVKNSLATQDYLEVQLFGILNENGVEKEEFLSYLEDKGLRLIKQGNFYFHKKSYENYGEYKKIEFRY